MRSVAVVGASLAGLQAVQTLRREGFDGVLHFIGDEPHPPYDRPPLSKQLLAGDYDTERIALTSAEDLDELELDVHFGDRAVSLAIAPNIVELASGATLDVDGVVIATGARCRTLGEPMYGLFTLRTLDDALGLRQALDAGPQRLVVVGAGFIGAEVAATAREKGIDVTMVEAAAMPCERALGAEMGAVLADVHRDHGVDLRLGVGVSSIDGDAGRVTGVTLSDGSVVAADVVVVGIGVIPNTEWLSESGIDISNGVLCDETSAAAPSIVAAGDVARFPSRRFGEVMRVEHWDNATTQGIHAAKRLLHGEQAGAYDPTPWFWTDQYDRKIQLAGRTTDFDAVQVVTGDIAERRFAAIYRKADRIVAVLGFNRPRHVMRYRGLIDEGASFDDALAADF